MDVSKIVLVEVTLYLFQKATFITALLLLMIFVEYQFSSVQFVTLLKQNVLRGCIGLLEQVGFKPSPELSSTYQW